MATTATVGADQDTTPVNIKSENSTTLADLDPSPSSPSSQSTEPPESATDLSLNKMASYAELLDQNARLKAQLAQVVARRNGEHHAYRNFITSLGKLNTTLGGQNKTPELTLVYQELVRASNTYRSLIDPINQPIDNRVNASSPALMSAPNLVPRPPTMQGPPGTLPPQLFNPVSHRREMARLVRNTLAKLQAPRPAELVSFEATLNVVEHNIISFAPFLMDWLNGRHRVLTSGLRGAINEVTETLCADSKDAKKLTDQIMKIVKANIRYTEKDVRGVGGDLIGPVCTMLWALVNLWEADARY